MSTASLKILCRYQYDPLDRLIGVGVLERTGTQRFYQQDHLTTELGEQAQRTIFRHQARPLAQQQNTAGVTATTLLATDQAHSPLQTLGDTNPQQLAYTAYGHHPAESGLSRLLGFNGECPDVITGHYLLGNGTRAFNPMLMRFNSPDELSPFGKGGVNPYAYCGGDPINFSDPTGNSKLARWIARHTASLLPPTTINAPKSLRTIKPTATTIGQSNLARRNPMLVNLLEAPDPTVARSAPSASTSTSELVDINPIPSGLTLNSSDAALSSRQQDLANFEASYDYNLNRPGFRTVATMQQAEDLLANKTRYYSSKSDALRKIEREIGRDLLLQIKKNSVKDYYIQKALQEIRQ
ncbi:RHS repeat-associated protein [Pseudomonas lini]|uniref:RHS repeat-associated core domain-containing protein n=1 Tax=Pseudomonas lini TaxID=163011 RepID=UPI002783FA0E|nr:RHS repeat-associated core domain-containing protein [Pseudomonas lini]MDQ0122332.1 RHS repeat-associated protein [Pseudomonas lini]